MSNWNEDQAALEKQLPDSLHSPVFKVSNEKLLEACYRVECHTPAEKSSSHFVNGKEQRELSWLSEKPDCQVAAPSISDESVDSVYYEIIEELRLALRNQGNALVFAKGELARLQTLVNVARELNLPYYEKEQNQLEAASKAFVKLGELYYARRKLLQIAVTSLKHE